MKLENPRVAFLEKYHCVPVRGVTGVAIVDAKDRDAVAKHTWSARRGFGNRLYARTFIDGKQVTLHRFICTLAHGAPPPDYVCDVINGDMRDCRRDNLKWSHPDHTTYRQNNPEKKRRLPLASARKANLSSVA